jgi:NAD(P)-dependent dehydrogenase (short-subunit alcohol dehydrogenase family)
VRDQVVVVTGASAGVGRATVRAFAARGARIGLIAAIVHAADHPRRRERWVGASTVATLLVQKVAPGLLDRYLARTGFGAQQVGQPVPPDAPDNLWEPWDADRDYGAHGRFDDRAKRVR